MLNFRVTTYPPRGANTTILNPPSVSQEEREFTKGWFPEGWFWPMFPGPPKPERGYKTRNDGTQNRGIQSIYLHRSGPLLENGLDKPESCYGLYGFASFCLTFQYLPWGWMEPGFASEDFFIFALWVVVVDISQTRAQEPHIHQNRPKLQNRPCSKRITTP